MADTTHSSIESEGKNEIKVPTEIYASTMNRQLQEEENESGKNSTVQPEELKIEIQPDKQSEVPEKHAPDIVFDEIKDEPGKIVVTESEVVTEVEENKELKAHLDECLRKHQAYHINNNFDSLINVFQHNFFCVDSRVRPIDGDEAVPEPIHTEV
jgi:hypothetical protein